MAQIVNNLPAVQETWIRSLGWEDTLEAGMATHSCILAWRILMDRRAWWATVHAIAKSQRVRQQLSNLACLHERIDCFFSFIHQGLI